MKWRRTSANLASLSIVALYLVLAAATPAATKKPPLKPVNINAATSEELQQVPGIGPATAEKILQMRKSYGAFKSVDDLLAIKGLGRKRLEKMRKYLTVSKTAFAGKPNCPGCAKSKSGQANAPPKNPSPATDPSETEEPPATPPR
jgi:competence ComEA-like helix-hairpin-helix protein